MAASMSNRVYIYDSTLRDGAQARGVDFTVSDKIAIAKEMDAFGFDYIEGGWPGANPADDQFFAEPPALKRATLTAFGMTAKAGRSAANDPGLNELLNHHGGSLCIVGKSWDFQVETALRISLKENLKLISGSLGHIVAQGREAVFDAEHFFDGYKANPAYALEVAMAAYHSGARWVVLCDTNGGTLPHEVAAIVAEVCQVIPGEHLGIHCHNDTENAVANSLAAVQAGVRQVQGTLNGVGERCGNANLISIIPNLMLKMGFETGIAEAKLKNLTRLSRMLDERLNRAPNAHAAYVGEAAFAHKGGLHVSAMARDTRTYEHIHPEQVGNKRAILISDKSGRSNLVSRLKELGLSAEAQHEDLPLLMKEVKQREMQGFAYDGADASFELLARQMLGDLPDYFMLESFRVMDERRWNAKGAVITVSEATVKVKIGGERVMMVAEGNGPVNALDGALRKALEKHYPKVRDIVLSDYKVRILTPQDGTKAITRVMIESRDAKGAVWNTVGVSGNVIDASFKALFDALVFKLVREKTRAV